MIDGQLGSLIEGFLAADGFAVERPAPYCLRGSRAGAAGEADERRYIWFSDPEHGVAPGEAALLQDFEAARAVLGPNALGFLVVPSLAGLSPAFRQQARSAGIGVRVPVQFFDTAYKSGVADAAFGEGQGAEAGEIFRSLERHGRDVAATRVAQPFERLTALGAAAAGFDSGPDILSVLRETMTAPRGTPLLTLVVGNAGAGKSHLFAALFADLYSRFMAAKRGLRTAARPIAFLPDHIREKQVATLDGLLGAVTATDAAAATSPALMRFLNGAGFTTWMFDGLDEVFAGESDFVAALEASLAPGSRSRILVCARDSLLTTSSALKGLIDRHIGDGRVEVFELARWQRPSQRALAYVRLVGRMPGAGETTDPADVAGFLSVLEASPAAAELATLPFYCDLMLEFPGGSESRTPRNELELLATAIDALIDREQAKLAAGELGFHWDVFAGSDTFVGLTDLVEAWGPEVFGAARDRERLLAALEEIGRGRLLELIEGLAHQIRTTVALPNASDGLDCEEIEDMANIYLDVGLKPDIEPRVLLALVQFAFFGPGTGEGRVRFSHEIVADFLAGREALRILGARPESPDSIAQALGVREDLDRSILLRYLVDALAREPELAATIRAHIEAGRVRERSAQGARHLLAAMQQAGLA